MLSDAINFILCLNEHKRQKISSDGVQNSKKWTQPHERMRCFQAKVGFRSPQVIENTVKGTVEMGLAGLAAPGQVTTEDNDIPPDFPFPRVSEQTALALAAKGVNASVMRLPQVHNTIKQGLVTYLIAMARDKGVSAYVGKGHNRWAAGHVLDVAHLYRLALEKRETGAKYHAVAEEGVAVRDIAEAISKGLKVPVVSLSPEEAQAHFGWLSVFASSDLAASSAQTRKKLGWNPTGPALIADLERMRYPEVLTTVAS
jgi:hypothetical protein